MARQLPPAAPIRAADRDTALLAKIREQCPADRLDELEVYLHRYPLLAARPQPAAGVFMWGGLCIGTTIFVDPGCGGVLEIYLHELAHATVGGHRGHDTTFQKCAEALYQRFSIERGDAGRRYDIQDSSRRSHSDVLVNSSTGWTLAQSPIKVEKLKKIGQFQDQIERESAARLELSSVLLPLLFIGVPGLIYITYTYFNIGELLKNVSDLTLFLSVMSALIGAAWWCTREND